MSVDECSLGLLLRMFYAGACCNVILCNSVPTITPLMIIRMSGGLELVVRVRRLVQYSTIIPLVSELERAEGGTARHPRLRPDVGAGARASPINKQSSTPGAININSILSFDKSYQFSYVRVDF